MSRVNFELPSDVKMRVSRKIKRMGYQTESEFWRAKAREVLDG